MIQVQDLAKVEDLDEARRAKVDTKDEGGSRPASDATDTLSIILAVAANDPVLEAHMPGITRELRR